MQGQDWGCVGKEKLKQIVGTKTVFRLACRKFPQRASFNSDRTISLFAQLLLPSFKIQIQPRFPEQSQKSKQTDGMFSRPNRS